MLLGLFGSRLWWSPRPGPAEPAPASPAVPKATTPEVSVLPTARSAPLPQAKEEPTSKRAMEHGEVKHPTAGSRKLGRTSRVATAKPLDSDPLSEEQAPNPFVRTPDLGSTR